MAGINKHFWAHAAQKAEKCPYDRLICQDARHFIFHHFSFLQSSSFSLLPAFKRTFSYQNYALSMQLLLTSSLACTTINTTNEHLCLRQYKCPLHMQIKHFFTKRFP